MLVKNIIIELFDIFGIGDFVNVVIFDFMNVILL